MTGRVRGRPIRALTLATVVALAAFLRPFAGRAAAAGNTKYLVTYVPRDCPSYDDIFANRARNDIMESLNDLGPDSQYTSSDFEVNPVSEGLPPQTVCRPITNWRFTLGTGYQSRAVTGPWRSLSKVTDPYSTVIRTQASTPLLDRNGRRLGNPRIAGAVTVALTKQQADRASISSSLWLQGGTAADLVLTGTFSYAISGGGTTTAARATTTAPNVPVNAKPSPLSLAPGTYTISEKLPNSADSTWRLLSVRCNGQTVTARPAQVQISSGLGSVCTFTNGFTPRGSISVSKVTYGGTGISIVVINSGGAAPAQFLQHATSTH
jgi:hypothetical protein